MNENEFITNETQNEPKNNPFTKFIALGIVVIVIVVGAVYWIVHSNAVKQEQIHASERIDYLCDELYDMDEGKETSEFEKAQDKLDEIDNLIDKHGLEEKKDKYLDVKSYIEDLKTLHEIEEIGVYTQDREELKQIHAKVNSVRSPKVIAKIDKYIDIWEENVEMMLINNIIEDYQDYLFNNNECSFIEKVLYFDDNSYEISRGNGRVNISARGCNSAINTELFYSYLSNLTADISEKVMDNIRANGNRAIIIEYKDYAGEGWVGYLYVNYEVEAVYSNGILEYNVTKYSDGSESTETGLRCMDVLKKELNLQ